MRIPPDWFVGIYVFSPIAIFYFSVIQLRRYQYRKLAKKVSAIYVSEGLFKTGKIIGTRNEREFTVAPYTTGGRASRFRTSVSMSCRNEGINLIIEASFFKNFPDWKWIFTIADRRVVTHLMLRNAPIVLKERYKPKIVDAFNELAIDMNARENLGRRGTIRIGTDKVRLEVDGILKKSGRLEQILLILERISTTLERSPIS